MGNGALIAQKPLSDSKGDTHISRRREVIVEGSAEGGRRTGL
jgi:hypothetical protein